MKRRSKFTKTSKLTQLIIFMHKIGIDLGGTKIEGILLDEKYNTIAGLVLFESKTIPDPGQEFRFFNVKFRILQKKSN